MRPCPICDSIGPRRVLHRQRFLDGPLGDGYDVVICQNCGAGFADGIPEQAELDRYYADRSKYEYTQSGGVESIYDFARFEAIVREIVPFVPDRQAAILDVGCATGGLLACFAHSGYTSLLGSDPSPACAAAARKLHRLTVRCATIAEMAGWDERFDLILLVGVLEHLRDVSGAVDAVARLLAPGGSIYCAQPDVEAFTACQNAPYQQFSVEHVNFLSKTSLIRLMERSKLAPRHTARWMIQWREGVTDSVVSGLFGRTAAAPALRHDQHTENALAGYLSQSQHDDIRITAAVDELVRSRECILIWGAGTLARRLLRTTRLAEANISAFIDSNIHLQGTRLAGHEVIAPRQLVGRREPVVICSRAFEREITTMIREEFRLKNRIIAIGQ
jgi:2-polyprenyl-3-methyl-5-hydroxy-6-metoxy-1,4-benzoquinol methylase